MHANGQCFQNALAYFASVIFCNEIDTCSLYFKHITMVNYDSSIVNKFGASLTDDARVVIYDFQKFIVEATGLHQPY
jgi:hypothetical protein